ncbi:1-acyl-sn-glycerol-3-phosphate acyltransferase [Actinomycetospora sp.]|uniref:1-acyl-sn-glycerol-3-phosphate acyltransferase n=1 Tax=Actinomycetospora sp. TaxID=1872135 RepID=UPI002F4042EF
MELDEVPRTIARSLSRTASNARGAGRSAARTAQDAVPHADTPEVAAVRSDPAFLAEIDGLATELDRTPQDVLAEATEGLREMAARHDRWVGDAWSRLGRWMLRGYDVVPDQEGLDRLRELDREHSLIFLISHRSYLDEWAFPAALDAAGISPCFGLAGANLDFFPLGTVARRTGIVHVRRATTGTPVYRLALRRFVGRLVGDGSNLIWSIEGGRSRTGKLRPPRYGLLRYVADAVEAADTREALVVPISIVYDQLPAHEVGKMADEVGGGAKSPEDVRWFAGYMRGLRRRLGSIYLDVGEPFGLRERLAELRAADATGGHEVERVALDVCHRINRATPVTPTAAVCVALLAADRALTLDETVATVHPLARHLEERGWTMAGGADLTDRGTVRRALGELDASGVLIGFSGGRDTVWGIAPERHLVASVYRNSAVHALLTRGVVELALQAVATDDATAGTLQEEAMRLRELLKFDFFFADRDRFAEEVAAEVGLIAEPGGPSIDGVTPGEAAEILRRTDLRVAHLTLRPFLEAYAVVADELAAVEPGTAVVEKDFLSWCLRVARQQAMQRRLVSWESVSSEMLSTALRLARHRGLLGPADGEESVDGAAAKEQLTAHRRGFSEEVQAVRAHLATLSVADDGPVLTDVGEAR